MTEKVETSKVETSKAKDFKAEASAILKEDKRAACGEAGRDLIMQGRTTTAKTVVSSSNTARAVKSGELEVFATPSMIALMEEAASACLSGLLEQGQTSVGTEISVAHTAASGLGAEITAFATITGATGRKVEFKISACEGEKEIGNGQHTRMIVDKEKFLMRIEKK